MKKIWTRYNEALSISIFGDEREDYVCGLEWAVQSRILKVKTKINMYTAYDIPIATVEKGDRVVDKIVFNQPEAIIECTTFLY